MEDMNKLAKQKILEQIMEMMDEKMADPLKSKSPKFMKVEVEASKPTDMEEVDPMADMKESMEEEPSPTMNPSEDEDMERLKEMYERLK